jgi:hypothetical protein
MGAHGLGMGGAAQRGAGGLEIQGGKGEEPVPLVRSGGGAAQSLRAAARAQRPAERHEGKEDRGEAEGGRGTHAPHLSGAWFMKG